MPRRATPAAPTDRPDSPAGPPGASAPAASPGAAADGADADPAVPIDPRLAGLSPGLAALVRSLPPAPPPRHQAEYSDDGYDDPDDYRRYADAPAGRAFVPVPVHARHDGWTPARQRGFIEALADGGCVTSAAASQGMRAETAYRLRRRPEAEDFRRAWAAALAVGVQRLTDIAIERAIHGVAEPVFYKGEIVGERRRYDNKLLMFALRHHDPSYMPGIQHAVGYDSVAFHAERTGEVETHLAAIDPPAPAPAKPVPPVPRVRTA